MADLVALIDVVSRTRKAGRQWLCYRSAMRHVHLGPLIFVAMLVTGLIMAFIGPNLIPTKP